MVNKVLINFNKQSKNAVIQDGLFKIVEKVINLEVVFH